MEVVYFAVNQLSTVEAMNCVSDSSDLRKDMPLGKRSFINVLAVMIKQPKFVAGGVVTICVYAGCMGVQLEPFTAAIVALNQRSRYHGRFQVDYIYNKDLHKEEITFSSLIDKMMGFHIHVILTHPHMGMIGQGWSMTNIESCLYRLATHTGHPDQFMLLDPILTQDKFHYIELCPDLFMPTLRICQCDLEDEDGLRSRLNQFCEGNSEIDEAGQGRFVVKASHTANSEYVKTCTDVEGIVKNLKCGLGVQGHRAVPIGAYLMVQYCYLNRKEYKVVVFNGQARYITIPVKQVKPIFAFKNIPCGELVSTLNAFAEKAVQLLKQNCPYANTNCLIRVDIMQNSAGDLRVNEFESLEANVCATPQQQPLEHALKMDMTKYYEDVMAEKLNIYL